MNAYEINRKFKQLKAEIAELSKQTFEKITDEIERNEKLESLQAELKLLVADVRAQEQVRANEKQQRAQQSIKDRDEKLAELIPLIKMFGAKIDDLRELGKMHDRIVELSTDAYIANEIGRSGGQVAMNLYPLHIDNHHHRLQKALISLFGARITDKRGWMQPESLSIKEETDKSLRLS